MKKIFHPSNKFILIFCPIIFVLLALLFAFNYNEMWFSYIIYPLSAYSLIIIVIKVIKQIKKVCEKLPTTSVLYKIIYDRKFSSRISLIISLIINILFSILKIVSSFLYLSIFDFAVGVYYILLSVIRFILLKKFKDKHTYQEELEIYRNLGIFNLALNISMICMIVQMVFYDVSIKTDTIMVISSAAYTFYLLITSIVNVIRYRKYNSPILSAVKNLSFTVSLMSLFSLQTTMIVTFSNNDSDFPFVMNAITGSAVSLFVLLFSICMIVNSSKKLKKECEKS